MLNIIISIVGIVTTILLVVGIHELGHFLVAKLCGIKVLRFSIGFGKALFSWHDKSGTEYVLAAIPLGGYVKMLDKEDKPAAEENHLTFSHQPFYKKFMVIAAGPLFNLVLAFVIYWALFVIGFVSVAPIVGTVQPQSIAALAGIKPQQEIIAVDNKRINGWMGIIVNILARAGDRTTMTLQLRNPHSEKEKNYILNLSQWKMDKLRPDPLKSIGIAAYDPIIPNIIGKVIARSPAEIAGLKVGDQIISVEGHATPDWVTLVENIITHPNEKLKFTVKRKHSAFTLPITIGSERISFFKNGGYLGLSPAFTWPKELLRTHQYPPLKALGYAWDNLKLFTHLNVIVFGKLLTGKISIESLGGPITIFESAGDALNNGIIPFFSFLAFLSISIGIVNILPIPGLDGGHLLFQLIEFIIRRPVAEKTQLLLYRLGMIFLLVMMAQALINDVLRL
jgi:regulator of sigma E protease